MFLSKTIKIKQISAFSILILINFIFAFKYLSRNFEHSLFLSICYISILIILFILLQKFDLKFFKSKWFYYSLVVLYSIGHIVLFHFIKVETLNVDRWSVISSFWEQAFKGLYPYNAQSHMGNYPAPLPFYFILALPFNLVGEIGYLSLLGVILLSVFLRNNLSAKNSIGAVIILFLSVSVFWEISVRSTILINSVLFMIYLFWIESVNFDNKKQFWASAVLGGFLLSTRTVFALPLVIYVIFLLKSNEVTLKTLVGWSMIVVGVLMLTFLPFLILYFPEFLIRNPFNVQTDHLFPFGISLIFLALSVISGFISFSRRQVLYYTSGIFVLVLITYFYLFIYRYGFLVAYFQSSIDLSYMLFAFPFLLYFSFSNNKSKR